MERNIILDPKIMKAYACIDDDEGKGGFDYFERGFGNLINNRWCWFSVFLFRLSFYV